MAKTTGIALTKLSIDDDGGVSRDLRSDIPNFDFSTPYGQQVVTGCDKSAEERLALLADFTGTLNGIFDPGANLAHVVLSGDLRVARTWDLEVASQTLTPEVLFSDYKLTRAANGALTWQAPFALQSGIVPTWGP